MNFCFIVHQGGLENAGLKQREIYILKMGMYQFGLRLSVRSYRRPHHGDASSASL